jgi:hypothetical protein
MNKLVYLAGPIAGLMYEDCVGWREDTIKELAKFNITGISPIVKSKRLENENRPMSAFGYPKDYMATERVITIKDKWYCLNSSALLVNFLGSKQISIGTVMEIAWASLNNTPIVVVLEEDNVHNHGMLNECTTVTVRTLNEGIEAIKALFDY